MRILAISGSLRARSSNRALVEAARLLAPPSVQITRYTGLDALPHFNPDLDGDPPSLPLPPAVAELRSLIGRADGLLISTPEYAHGLPGALKNALDWLVASTEFPGMPVALLNASARSVHAQPQLVEVLTTMSAHLVSQAFVTMPPVRAPLTPEAIVADPQLATLLRQAIVTFVHAVELLPTGGLH